MTDALDWCPDCGLREMPIQTLDITHDRGRCNSPEDDWIDLIEERDRLLALVGYCDLALTLDPGSLEWKDWFQGLAAELVRADPR